jgi:2-(3-amino-3-carboxypropyl)histidine synthase
MALGSDRCTLLEDIPYEIRLDYAVEAVRRTGARRVIVKMPDGLKPYGWAIVKCLEATLNNDVEVYLHMDSTFGACDLHYGQLEASIKPDVIVHIGHSPYPAELAHKALEPRTSRIVYVPALSKAPVTREAVEEASRLLRERGVRRVGLATTAQHVHQVRLAARMLSELGFEAVVPRGLPPYFSDAQTLGCDYRLPRSIVSRVDGFLYLGGGLFHPLGLYLSTLKPVVRLDPYRNRSDDLTPEGEKVYRVRLSKVADAFGADNWGIIVGVKSGQYRPWLVRRIVEAVKSAGKQYMLLASEVTTVDQLIAVDSEWFDAFVVTNCPRIPTDDLWNYRKPVLTPGEAFMALQGRLEPYRFPW